MEEILPKEQPGACLACGSAPVSHGYTFMTNTLDAWLNDRVRAIGWLSQAAERIDRFGTRFEPFALQWAHWLSGGRVSKDPAKAATNRAAVLWEEARRRGIEMEQIVLWGKYTDSYRVNRGGRYVYFDGLPIPYTLQTRSYAWVDDKYLFKRFLHDEEIPTARAFVTDSLADAMAEFARFGAAVVVKPRVGSRGRHTTTNVRTREEFERAFVSAKQLCRYVLCEEHLSGKLCRATLAGGKLVGFLKKSQPEVTGDGTHTIRELVRMKNEKKPERVWNIVLGAEHEAHVRRHGYGLDDVLPAGITIDVSADSGRYVGGETREMPESIHPKLREYLERITRTLAIPLVGFDLIISDPEQDPDTQKWGILEANTLPFIDLHYNPLYGTTSNVAAAVWDLWDLKSPASAGR